MFIAWWTGQGYRSILIVAAAAILLELVRAALRLTDGAWVFGLALLCAAAANWKIGRKLNNKSLRKVRSNRIRDRLLYRARHKFMSLPMETFSIGLAGAGAALLIAWVSGLT